LYDDKRSKEVLLVAHCFLNQNAKLDECAYYPGVIREASEVLIHSDIGILQMPCPELLCLGLDRQVEKGTKPTVEDEDTRIANRLAEEESQSILQRIVDDLIYQIQEYRENGFTIRGIVGMNGSPSCGVELTWADDEEKQGPGAFIHILKEKLRQHGWDIPMKGIKAYEPEEAVSVVKSLL
jgi:predicted secreted protein